MKTYWSIPHEISREIDIVAFDKLDGSNIRAEWSSKKKFYKFGTRTRLLSEDEPILGKTINMIKDEWEEKLSFIFNDQKYERVIVFFEFCGKNSFAGQHQEEEHRLYLIDVCPYKKGILPPEDFISSFGHLDIPKIIYRGKVTKEFEEAIQNSLLPGVTLEGVVCKGLKKKQLKMFKIKSKKWLDKLHSFCDGDEELFRKLS